MGAEIRPDPTPLVESRVERFPRRAGYSTALTSLARFWDLSPDDQQVLVFARPDSGDDDGRYVVVENFGEELKRLAPLP
jgi:hypothetical protein